MTGYLSQLADNIAVLNIRVVLVSLLAISAFIAGAGFSTLLINWAKDTASREQYAWPLAIQGTFLVCFSAGGVLSGEIGRLFALACLCFIMGMQNATITKISGARIRTTHATGMITDIGIEAGRAIFSWLRPETRGRLAPPKLGILIQLVSAFLGGGIIGAVGYGLIGFLFSLPLAVILLSLSVPALVHRRGRR